MNDYWNRPRRERWERFQKYLENEPENQPGDNNVSWIHILVAVVLWVAVMATILVWAIGGAE